MLIFTISKKDLYWISLFHISYYGYIITYNHKEIIIKPIHFIWLFLYNHIKHLFYYGYIIA